MTEDELEGALKKLAREQGVEHLVKGEPALALDRMSGEIYRRHNRLSPERQRMARTPPPPEQKE